MRWFCYFFCPVHTALALAPLAIRTTYAQLAANTGTSATSQLRSSTSTGPPHRPSCSCGSGRALQGVNKDAAPATSHTQSHLAKQFFVAAASQLADTLALPSPLACAPSSSAPRFPAPAIGSWQSQSVACSRPSTTAISVLSCVISSASRCFCLRPRARVVAP